MKSTLYIARTDNTDVVLELRQGELEDIAESERHNWRLVMEQPATIDAVTQSRKLQFTASGDNPVVMTEIGEPLPIAWGLMQLRAHAASKRWQMETGGLSVAGIDVRTDDTAQRKISELRRRVEAGEIDTPFTFKAVNGWVSVDATSIAALDRAIAQHVHACYRAEKAADDAIGAGTVKTSADVDALMEATHG